MNMNPAIVRNILISLFFVFYISTPIFNVVHGSNYSMPLYWFFLPFSIIIALSNFYRFIDLKSLRLLKTFSPICQRRISLPILLLIFSISLLQLYLYPWHVDRSGFAASLSALIRITWLAIAPFALNSTLRRDNYLYILFYQLFYRLFYT